MKLLKFFILSIIILFFSSSQIKAKTNDYFAIPPFLGGNVKPNVLIILDNSGSMKFPAYWPNSKSKTDTSFNPDRTYTGIFNPKARYSYSYAEKAFYPDSQGDWSGNFLNWLTTRRYDTLLKALIGGNIERKNGKLYLRGLNITEEEYYDYEFKKKCSKNFCKNYLPKRFKGKEITVGVDCDGKNATRTDRFCFEVKRKKGVKGKKFAIRVRISKEPEGIIQKYLPKVRMGLMNFNKGSYYETGKDKDGGKVVSYIADNNTEILTLFQDIDKKTTSTLYPHMWTPLAETYYEAIRYFRAQESAYNEGVNYKNHDPIQLRCQQNYVILVTDGESTMDKNVPGTAFEGKTESVEDPNFNIKDWMDAIANNEETQSEYDKERGSNGTYYLEGTAYYAHVSDLREDLPGKQNLNLFVIYTYGKSGSKLLKMAAKYGGFIDLNNNGVPDLQSEWDKDKDEIPDNYFEAGNEDKLTEALNSVFQQILNRASSGSALSIPMKSGKHKNLALQAIFYPEKLYSQNAIFWTGDIYTWWLFNRGNIFNLREDNADHYTLNVLKDYILEWELDNDQLIISAYKSYESGEKSDNLTEQYSSFNETSPIYSIGEKLLSTSANSRHIYTTLDGKNFIEFKPSNASRFILETSYESNTFKLPILGIPAECFNYCQFLSDCSSNSTNATRISFCMFDKMIACMSENDPDYYEKLIKWVRGVDYPDFRSRRTSEPVVDTEGSDINVWKLGDIIYSSPISVSYDNYTVTFVGANDGMLHAFKTGYTKATGDPNNPVKIQNEKQDESTSELGKELWAYIPQNVLPYLAFLADPNYKHIYTVDLRPYVVRIKDRDKEKIILIGGLRLGGATESHDDIAINPPDYACPASLFSIIKTYCESCMNLFPVSLGFSICDLFDAPVDYSNCIGLSSYFAIDVTDPENPKLLWEFPSHNFSSGISFSFGSSMVNLNFSYSGPAIIEEDGKYYLVIATGPINYSGEYSSSNTEDTLNLVIIDLLTGSIKRIIETDIYPAFSGRLFTTGVDLDNDGNTDYVFLGFTKQDNSKQFSGGIAVLVGDIGYNLELYPLSKYPLEQWKIKTFSQLGSVTIPPVTSKIEAMKCFNNWYIYFGTGRWFTKNDNWEENDNYLFGIPLIPHSSTGSGNYNNFDYITFPQTFVDVSNQQEATNICQDAANKQLDGWYLQLESSDENFLREKDISDPTPSDQNVIIFTTIKPTRDACSFGGKSRLWGLNCALGTSIDYSCPEGTTKQFNIQKKPKGVLFLQLSNGNIYPINLSSGFTENNNRTTSWYTGIAPETSTPLITPGGIHGELLLWLEK